MTPGERPPITVAYGTLCDMVADIQGAERQEQAVAATEVAMGRTPVEWSPNHAEAAAMRRALCMVVGGGYRTTRYQVAWAWLKIHLTVEVPSGQVVIDLIRYMEGQP